MAEAIGPANIGLNLATEEFRTCCRNNTVNGEVLEYLCPVSAGISGESTAAAAEGPWSSRPFPTHLQGLSQTLVLPELRNSLVCRYSGLTHW
jgi:hypothetical protein